MRYGRSVFFIYVSNKMYLSTVYVPENKVIPSFQCLKLRNERKEQVHKTVKNG